MLLDPDLLARIRSRADGYDRDNAFFTEDLDELRAAGYLAPRPLLETARDQRLLAAYAPATALGINMHLVWTGVARVLSERGDHSLDWVLEDAAAGELFAFGNSEPGNDLVLWDARTTAEPSGDGWAFTGTKIFTSLSPAWTRLGVFGRHGDQLIHGFITRDTPGWHSLDDWDTLGMRATQSQSTVLAGAVVPAERVARVLPVGPNADPFIFGIFANFLLLIGSVYAGIADRALELAVDAVGRRKTMRSGTPYSQHPDFRWRIADAALALDAIGPQLESARRRRGWAGRPRRRLVPSADRGQAPRDGDRTLRRRPGHAVRRWERLPQRRACPPAARRSGGHLPPERHGVRALDRGHEPPRPARLTTLKTRAVGRDSGRRVGIRRR